MTEYLIFVSDNGNDWRMPEGAECAGSSADSAKRTYLANLDDAEAPRHIAAIPARSWKPRTVRVSTVKQVTLS